MITKSQLIYVFNASPVFAWGLAKYIELTSERCFVAVASSHEEFERTFHVIGHPDVVVIDEKLFHEAGIRRQINLLQFSGGVHWLVTACDEKSGPVDRYTNGVMHSFIHENSALKEFWDAICSLLPEHRASKSSRIRKHGVQNVGTYIQSNSGLLTPRQEEVYELVLRGLSNKRIAQMLDISEATIKEHVTGILEKLGFKNRIEALANARTSVELLKWAPESGTPRASEII